MQARLAGRCALLLPLLANALLGLDPNLHVSQYGHNVWRMQDGMFPGTPHAITQTADGYLWIGTEGGLVRFDGVHFVPWEPPAGKQLLDSRIYSLLGAKDGTLWIGTAKSLERWKSGELFQYSELNGRVNAILEDPDGAVWMIRTRLRDNKGPLCAVRGKELSCHGEAEGLGCPTGSALVQDKQGSLWIGCSLGLSRWNRGSAQSYFPASLKRFEGLGGVQAIAVRADGSLWAGIGAAGEGLGLQQFSQGQWKELTFGTLKTSSLDISSLLIDRDDSLWVGTSNQGIYHIRGAELDHFGSEDGLSSNSVEGLFQDREGNMWVATSKGIDCFRNLAVTTISRREGLSSDHASTVLAAQDGSIWIGNRGGLDVLRGDTVSSISAQNGLPGHIVNSIFQDHSGTFWIGVDTNLYTLEHGQFRPVQKADIRSPGIAVAIAEDNEQTIWAEVVGRDRRLIRIRDRTIQEEIVWPSNQSALAIAADPAGGIWLGLSSGGLGHYRQGKLETFAPPPEERTMLITNLLVDADGTVWAAGTLGLVRWKNGTWQTLGPKNGLPCSSIFSLTRDKRGTMWLYANCGVITIPQSELAMWSQRPDAKVNVKLLDAFAGAEPSITSYRPTAAVSSNGRLLFVNDQVVQTIDPDNLHLNETPPPVLLQQVVANSKILSPLDALRLPPLMHDLQIDYTALSFTVPQKVRFRYRLEGRDPQWQDAQTRRQVFYTDLPPGSYTFRVKAANNDGVWNETGASWRFSIAPAYYQAAWFRILVAGMLISAAWTLYRYRVRQIADGLHSRFDERLEERTRLARELHDTLLQTIQGSKMIADDALDHAEPERMHRTLQQLSGWLSQATDEGRAALSSLRASTTQRNDLAEAFQRAGDGCTPKDSMTFELTVEGVARDMHPIVRDEVYRIGYEAIRNACMHSKGTRLEVQLSYTGDLILRIRDNGKGIDPMILAKGRPGHFGIQGIRERAERTGAKLTFRSSRAGTEVELIVPANLTFRETSQPQTPLAKFREFFRVSR